MYSEDADDLSGEVKELPDIPMLPAPKVGNVHLFASDWPGNPVE